MRGRSRTPRLPKPLQALWSVLVGLVVGLAAPVARGQAAGPGEALRVLDIFRGTWALTVTTHLPVRAVVTSVSTNAWVLGERFLQGDSGPKSDGSRDMSMMTYDPASGGYPLWIFYSTGIVFFLPSGKWDPATRTMVWNSPPNLSGSYQYRCELADPRVHRCKSIAKDWKGKVLLEQDVVAERQAP